MRTLRVGIVGAGRIVAAEHAPRFRAIEDVELVAVANRSADSSRRAAAELGIVRALDDWRTLVADSEVDAVLVGAWPYLHAPVTIAALEAGKHVLTEARMAATADDARAMLKASLSRPDLVAMVVPASFSLWADATILRMIEGGAIGRLRHVRAIWDAAVGDDPAEFWRWQRRYSGQNVMSLGIAYEAMARWLGHARAVSALSRIDQAWRPGPAGSVRSDVPDHVVALIEFPDDVTAVLEMSARLGGHEATRALFYGSEGMLEADFTRGSLAVTRPGQPARAVKVRDEDRAGWTAEIDFVASIRDGSAVTLTDFATGVAYMAFLEAVEQAAADGRRVSLH